jgi:hypothetical protein
MRTPQEDAEVTRLLREHDLAVEQAGEAAIRASETNAALRRLGVDIRKLGHREIPEPEPLVVACMNSDLMSALQGATMGVSAATGEKVSIRLMTPAEAAHAMRTAREGFGFDPEDVPGGIEFHAHRLTRPIA